MEEDIKILIASREDLNWVNEQYKELQFAPSIYENELIAIAQIQEEKVGVGRLINLSTNVFELGGIYVKDGFREKGIARKIVTFLLSRIKPFHTVYCLPFSHLEEFYQKMGFEICQEEDEVSEEILQRHKTCTASYDHKVLIMKLASVPLEPLLSR